MNKRTISAVVLMPLLFAFAFKPCAADPILRIETTPSPPSANQSFTANVYLPVIANSAAQAFAAGAVVNGHNITAMFYFDCGFLCPGGPSTYGPFPLKIPALPVGQYSLSVSGAASPPLDLGNVTFAVVPASIPIGDWKLLAVMGLLLLSAGCATIQRARR
jgi:hypothetical protein